MQIFKYFALQFYAIPQISKNPGILWRFSLDRKDIQG